MCCRLIHFPFWRRMELDCSNDRGLNFPISIRRVYKNILRNLFLLDADISYHMNTYKPTRRLKKNDAEIRTRGTRGRRIHACCLGKAALGREEITPGVRISCWVYVDRSGGRRSEADTTRYMQKNRKNETHPTVRSRTAVVHNIRDKAYPAMKASIT